MYVSSNIYMTGMKTAQAQPDFRLTENLLSLNSGSVNISMVNIILMPYSGLSIITGVGG